jgi:hypothetical protein
VSADSSIGDGKGAPLGRTVPFVSADSRAYGVRSWPRGCWVAKASAVVAQVTVRAWCLLIQWSTVIALSSVAAIGVGHRGAVLLVVGLVVVVIGVV